MRVDILTVGNALIDLLVSLPENTTFCRIDHETHELCIKAGQKIPSEHVEFSIGGGASRVAVGMKRLGFSSVVYADIGSDELAGRIKKTLEEERVSLNGLREVSQVTSFTVGLNFQKERTLFTHHVKAPHDFDFSAVEAKWIYLASLSNPWEKTYKQILFRAKKIHARVACNPGLFQLMEGLSHLKEVLEDIDILFVNKQEAQMLLASKEENIKLLLQEIGKMMPQKVVVITDGRNGSFATDGKDGYFHVGITESVVVERTGAGDGYATGFLAAIVKGQSVANAMQWGSLNAAAVVGEFGGVSGLLSEEGMQDALQKHTLPQVEEFI